MLREIFGSKVYIRVVTSKILRKKEFHDLYSSQIKVKQSHLQAWGGPEGSRKLRFPDFMTTAQGGGKIVSLTHRPHSPGTHFC